MSLKYKITKYKIISQKVNEPMTLALISDLHSKCYGTDNDVLLDSIRNEKPDLCLISGDMIVGRPKNSFDTALSFVRRLCDIAPVYYANGNHETEYRRYSRPKYIPYVRQMVEAGVHLLNNKTETLCLGSDTLRIAGLEVSLEKYIKFRKPHCDLSYVENKIGNACTSQDPFTILIAHNPEFFDTYEKWGADLTVSGHYHGGVVRSPFSGKALLSPYGYPFPKFGVGRMDFAPDRCIIASSGLGDHMVPLRIFNPRELVMIRVVPQST
jgi:hypothetical protein